jgi:hypothetical protein
MSRSSLVQKLEEYATQRQLHLLDHLGSGVHGIVFTAESQWQFGVIALKAHESHAGYTRERDVYLHLQKHQVETLLDCSVPRLLDHDDELQVLAMTIVRRPFVLDFAGAYLFQPPDFPEEVWAEWRAEKREQYGDRWPDVQAVLREIEQLDIHMIDVNPGNISFG